MAPPFPVKAAESPRGNPYTPSTLEPAKFDQFAGINTSTTRPGVDDKMMFWCDGFMPIGPNYLRTHYGVGSPISFQDQAEVSFFAFANISTTAYCVVIHVDGSMHAVNTDTYVATQIAPAGTIENPSPLTTCVSQYGGTYIVIVNQQIDGYFLWDGTVLYQAGGLSPIVTLTNPGGGYSGNVTASASGGSGSGATFLVEVESGFVVGITVTNPGTGYLATDTPHLTITGTHTGSAATASISLMPFAIGGTYVETYTGRVWIIDEATITFSAPGSAIDFSTANGGGNVTSADSFLRVRYTALIQANGFLYTIADSSVNYISGVQTSGNPSITTFSNQNADPEIGTPWPPSVTTLGRTIMLANAFGVHGAYGGAVVKVSDQLDGVYNTVADFGTMVPSAAKAIIFGKKVWMLLLPIIDPITKQQVNKLLMWNEQRKIWWASEQDANLIYIQSQEINSVLTAWGTDGTKIYPLFQQPSTGFFKRWQSKLWMLGGLLTEKAANRLWSMVQYYGISIPELTISVDNEIGVSTQTVTVTPLTMAWVTQTGETMNWTTAGGAPMLWFLSGINPAPVAPIGQHGVLIGLTGATRCDDMACISFQLDQSVVQYRG